MGSASNPRYVSIAETLRADIAANVFMEGSYLPSETALAERFGASPGTVRRALKVLVDEGTLSARRGAKKIVLRAPRPTAEFTEFRSFAQWAYGQGKTPGGKVVHQQWVEAEAGDIKQLRVQPGDTVLSVSRLRTLDHQPVMLEQTRYPYDVGIWVAELPTDTPSVTNYLFKERGLKFVAADHIFGVGVASLEQAILLEVSPGSPLLVHRHVSRDRFGTPLERSEDRYIADCVSLAVSNSRDSNSLSWTLDGVSEED